MQWQDLSCFSGHLPVSFDAKADKDLVLNWKEAPIPLATWRVIVAFMKWSYDEHKCEAQCRLTYSYDEKEWRIAVLPQRLSTGLFTKEIETDPDRATAFEECGLYSGFDFVGTVHHHCSSSAFQSGTDHKDELNQPGFHVTLGYLNKKDADYHSRASFRGVMYPEIDDKQWLPYTDEEVKNLDDLPEFPEAWKDRLKPPVAYRSKGRTGMVHTGGWPDNYTGYGGFNSYGYGDAAAPGRVYVGFGEGAVDMLPIHCRKFTTTPLYIPLREKFWDYMITVHACTDLPDMKLDKKLRPEGSKPWRTACEKGLMYALWVMNQPAKDRETIHEGFMEYFTLGTIDLDVKAQRWYRIKGHVTFSPDAIAYQMVEKQLAADADEAEDQQVLEAEEAEDGAKEEEATKDLDYSYLEEATFEEVASVLPVPPKLEHDELFVKMVEWLFDSEDVVSLFKDAMEYGTTFKKEGIFAPDSVSLTKDGVKNVEEVSSFLLRALHASAVCRVYIEEQLPATQLIELDSNSADGIGEAIAEMMPVFSLEELKEVKKSELKDRKPLTEWLNMHLTDMLIKAKVG